MEEIVTDAVGLEETVTDFERSVLESTETYQDVQIVGIVGPAGAGKTTLAKELYERKCPMAKRSIFLSHLRSTAGNALIDLQKKIVRDLLPDSFVKDLPIHSIDDGKIIVASYLRYVRVLLVLDDVDHVDQLDALLPGKGNLASGSLVIVTSRHSTLLTSWGISSIYKMEGLDPLHAMQLLYKHAVLSLFPPDGYKPLAERFVRVCDRLPLTLKLLGQVLQGKSQEYWQSQLQKVSKILPVDAKTILDHILFTLSEKELEFFIDTTCFFIGEKISLVIAAWDGLGWNGMHCWETLVKKCLVELDEKKRVRMHCELRDSAKEIAINRLPYRLWSPEQVVDIQEAEKSNSNKGERETRGIMAATSQFVVRSAHEEFPTYSSSYQPPFKDCMELSEKSSRSMKSVPLFKYDLDLALSSRWPVPLPAFSYDVSPDFSSKSIMELSEKSSRSMKSVPPSKYDLDLALSSRWSVPLPAFSYDVSPDFSSESIKPETGLYGVLSKTSNSFPTLPFKINSGVPIKSLKPEPDPHFLSTKSSKPLSASSFESDVLDFSCKPKKSFSASSSESDPADGVVKLKQDRSDITSLLSEEPSYESNFASYSSKSRKPLSRSLSETDRVCFGSKVFSPPFASSHSSTGLYFLVVRGSDLTEEFAALLEDLVWLRWFDFNHSSLPPWLSLRNLRVLELYGALSLKELWPCNASPPLMLRELIISSCWGSDFASFPPSISELRYLRKIALIGCIGDEFRLQELPDEFCSLQSLEHLELRCEALSTLPVSFRFLFNLQYLDLSGCRKLALRPDILEYVRSLENLYLSGCLKLQKLPSIENQLVLKQLHLQDTNLLQLPTDIDLLTELQVLTVGSPLLTSLPDYLGYLSSLRSLSIIDCIDMEALPPSLEHLSLLDCLYIKSSQLKSLAIWQFANLKTLKICDCPIERLDFRQGISMKKLNLLNLSQTLVASISISQDCCPMLEILQLEQNDHLLRIEVLPTTVKIVELSDCELLNDISGIDNLVNLRVFDKSGCPLLEKL